MAYYSPIQVVYKVIVNSIICSFYYKLASKSTPRKVYRIVSGTTCINIKSTHGYTVKVASRSITMKYKRVYSILLYEVAYSFT